MLVEHSTGLDLNDAGETIQGVDILFDIPQVISVARLRYRNGTRIELSYCATNSDAEDMNLARGLVPHSAIRLRGWDSDTLGCSHGDEHTFAFWVFE